MKLYKPFYAILAALVLSGCATSDQSMTSGADTAIRLELAGEGKPGTVVIVNNAQVSIVARPVGLDILNPAVAANAAYQQGANQTQAMEQPSAVAAPADEVADEVAEPEDPADEPEAEAKPADAPDVPEREAEE